MRKKQTVGLNSVEFVVFTMFEAIKTRCIDGTSPALRIRNVIRGHEDYSEIAKYILFNPEKWELDCPYSQNEVLGG